MKRKPGGQIIHGGYGTRLYNTWIQMKSRCNNKNNKDYKYYGGKGIKVCDEWLNDFAVFREWAVNNGYRETLTIDRIDNKEGYNSKNCQWISNRKNAIKRSFVKLDKNKANQIRQLLVNKITQKTIAEIFNIDQSMVSYIKTGKCWR